MKKVFNKRILAILMMAIVIFTLVGCNSTNTNVPTTEYGNVGDESDATEVGGDNIVVATPAPTPNPDDLPNNERTYTTVGNYHLFEELSSTNYNVDTSLLEAEPINEEFTLEYGLTIYNLDGYKAGFITPVETILVLAKNDEWTLFTATDGVNEKYFSVTWDTFPAEVIVPKVTPTPEVTPNPTPTPDVDVTPEPTPTPINVVEMSATKYAIQSVNVRKGPGTEYEKVGGLTTNQAVTVTGKTDNGWFRFTYNGAEVYVSGKYLSDTKVVVPTPAPTAIPGPAQTPAPAPTPSEGQEAELVLPDGSTIIVILPTPIPQSERISPDIIMARLEAAMYAAGYMKPEDWVRRDYPDEADELLAEFGPTAGMGWGIATIDNRSLEKVDEYVAEVVSVMSIGGWNLFYLEYVGVNPNNGWCDIKVYRGTH